MHLTQIDVAKANPELMGELHALMDRCNVEKPTKEDRRAFQKFIDEHPQLWTYAGNVVEQAIIKLVESAGGKGTLTETALKEAVTHMPVDLALPTDGALEQLLIQQIVLCWLRWPGQM